MSFTTRETIIEKIRAGEGVGWSDFESVYRQLVYMRGCDRGLRCSEKADLLQEVMISLFKGSSLLKYDQSKGRFRDYLKKIIDRRAFDILRKREDKDISLSHLTEGGALIESAEFEYIESKWQKEWQKHLLEQALEQVKSQVNHLTYEAFTLLHIDQITPSQVADHLGISIESVYVAKHRVLRRLKPIVENLKGQDL